MVSSEAGERVRHTAGIQNSKEGGRGGREGITGQDATFYHLALSLSYAWKWENDNYLGEFAVQ